MGRTTSLLLPGRGVAGTLSSLFVLFALAPAPVFAGVVSAPGNEAADSVEVAGGSGEPLACTVRFEHGTARISEGICGSVRGHEGGWGGEKVCGGDGTVNLTAEPGTATLDDDYTYSKFALFARFADDSDGTEAYGIQIIDDGIAEEDETFQIFIDCNVCGAA